MSRSRGSSPPRAALPLQPLGAQDLRNPQGPQSLQPYAPLPQSHSLGGDSVMDSIVEAATAADQDGTPQRRMVRVQSGVNRKVEFHKTKKLRKKASALYMHAMAEVGAGKFNPWSRNELVQLITSVHKIELRNEERLETVALRDLCESLYVNKPAPKKPDPPSFQQLVFENVMARRIQNSWIVYQASRRMREEEDLHRTYQAQVQDITGAATGDIGQAELMYMTMRNEMVVGGAVQNVGADMAMDFSGDVSSAVSPRSDKKKKKGMNVLDIDWAPPDVEKAQRYADYVQPRKDVKSGDKFRFRTTTTGRHCCLGGLGEQFDLWEEGQVSEFSTYGPGVTNYFKFMKWCFWLFTVLTVIALPVMVLNNSATAAVTDSSSTGNNGLKALARTTIGNLAVTYANETVHLAVPGCDNYGVYHISCTFNSDTLALFYAAIDIVVSVTIFAAFAWLSIFERLEESALEESTIRASMYTIAVTHLPPDVTEEELHDHFASFLKSKSPIVGISFAYDNVEEIKTCKKRGDLIRAKVHLVHEHRHKCTQLKKAVANEEEATKQVEDERQKFFERMKKLNVDLKAVEEQLAALSEKPCSVVYAFVTFDKSGDRNKVLDAYQQITAYTYLCNSAHLKLRGRFLRVKPAPEPSVIIWENLSVSQYQRNRRKIVTTFGALLLIVISLIMVFSSKYLQQSAANNGAEAVQLCPAAFGEWTRNDQRAYVDDNPSELYCYCNQFTELGQAADSYCRSYLRKNVQSQVLLYFASFIVLLVNFLIDKAVSYSSHYEKHHSSDGKGMSTFMRIFLLKYINTAAVFLINNNNIILRRVFGVQGSSTAEFSADWFNQVGTTIILVQLGDVVNAHAGHVLKLLRYWRAKGDATAHPERFLTQDDLNRAFAGPKFEFASNYAQLLSTLFVCLTFSTGIPLLYPIAAINFLLFYLVEKYMFVHVYKIPPHFNTLVGRRATALIPLAVLAHLVMSIWILSNNAMFNANVDDNSSAVDTSVFGTTVADKITAKATFPLFVTFCVLIFLRALMSFLAASWRTLVKAYMFFFSFLCSRRAAAYAKKKPKAKSAAKDVVAYTRAVQRNLIKGLSTYNILLNPTYKEAFGITWKFAAENKTVRDVRNIKAKAQVGADEDDADKADELTRRAALQGRSQRPDSGAAPKKKAMAKNRSFIGSFYGDLNQLARPPSDANMVPPQSDAEETKRGGSGSYAAVPTAEPGERTSGRLQPPALAPVAAVAVAASADSRSGRLGVGLRVEVGLASGSGDHSARRPSPALVPEAAAGGSRPGSGRQSAPAPMSPSPNVPGPGLSQPYYGDSGRMATPGRAPLSPSPSPGSGRYAPVPMGSPQAQPYGAGYGYPPPHAQQYADPRQGYAGPPPRSPVLSPRQQQLQYQQLQYIQQQQAAYHAAQQASRGGAPQQQYYGQQPYSLPPHQQDPRYGGGYGGGHSGRY